VLSRVKKILAGIVCKDLERFSQITDRIFTRRNNALILQDKWS